MDAPYDIEQYTPQTGRFIGEDGKVYNIVDLLKGSTESSETAGDNFGKFIPDRANRTAVLETDGTWTAVANGFVQRSATITHPSSPYATFRLYQNGVIAWANEIAGLLSTGLYELTSETTPVLAGDVITTESVGSGIASTLYFMPPRG